MLFNYLFLSSHFDRFAYQSEWLSVVYTQTKDDKNRTAYMKYLDCRESMADKMNVFADETKSFFGWVKSFIPSTKAFHARRQLGNQLQTAHNLFFNLSINYLKCNQVKKTRIEEKYLHENKQEKIAKPVIWKKQSVGLEQDKENNHLSERGMWSPVRRF